jgi:hypothetical protein
MPVVPRGSAGRGLPTLQHPWFSTNIDGLDPLAESIGTAADTPLESKFQQNFQLSDTNAQQACPSNDSERRGSVYETAMKDYAKFLRAIAAQVLEARLSNGARVLDASDFRQWLVELAEKAERAETLEQFLSQA